MSIIILTIYYYAKFKVLDKVGVSKDEKQKYKDLLTQETPKE